MGSSKGRDRPALAFTADMEAKMPLRLIMLGLRENQGGWLVWILVNQNNKENRRII